MGQEVEIKLEVPRQRARAVVGAPWLKKLTCGPAKREKLVSVYYDTPDLALHGRHALLRVRRIDDHFVQTFKAETSGAGPLERLEWETPVNGRKLELKKAGRKHTGGLRLKKLRGSLKPIFETTVLRHTIPLRYRKSLLELAVDEGQIKTGRHHSSIHEIEVELKDGEPEAVVALGRHLASKLKPAFGIASKAERGYALRAGEMDCPVFAGAISLSAGMTAAEAFQVIAMSCLHHFAANRAAVVAGEPEGVHQMRIGLRRLRAAISLFKEILRGPETERIKTGLRWLTEELGPARDMDVLIKGAIASLKENPSSAAAVAALKTDIAHRRENGFARARAAAESDRYRCVVLETAFWIAGGRWRKSDIELVIARRDGPARRLAAQEMQRRTAKITKQLAKIERLNPRQRHKLRIAVKKLRYATGYFESLFCDKRAKRRRKGIEKQLKALQSSLGELNDMRVHRKLAGRYADPPRGRRNAVPKAFAMGILSGKERAESRALMKDFRRHGKRFAARKAFWD